MKRLSLYGKVPLQVPFPLRYIRYIRCMRYMRYIRCPFLYARYSLPNDHPSVHVTTLHPT